MKSFLCLALLAGASAAAVDGNVMGKIFGMMDDMKTKIVHDGEAEQHAYEEYFEWCDDASKNKQFEIKTMTSKVEDLTSVIEKATGDAEAASSRVEELGGSISTAESDLKGATGVRKHEKEEFKAAELDLVDTVDKLAKAEGMLQKMSHGSFAQIDVKSIKTVMRSMGDLLSAASLESQDKKQLMALVQAQENSDDEFASAPAADAYSSHTGAILDLIVDMKEKAETELDELRSKEKEAENNFQMLKLSLEDQMDADKHEMSEQKQAKAEADGSKAQASGDLSSTQKSLDQANHALADMRQGCMQTAADHEETVKARAEELAVLAKARSILEESVGGAVKQSYGFIQLNTHSDLVKTEVITMVRNLARKHHSSALAQLASRVAAVVKYGSGAGQDPFAKVKGLITDLVAKLEKEAQEEATEKAYCDEQMGKTGAKKEELDNTFSKLTAKIDKAAAASAELKDEVKGLQADLANLAKTQAEMDKIRAEEKAAYTEAKTDLELGLEGVRKALGVLRDYYGSSSAAMIQDSDMSFMKQPAPPQKHSSSSDAGGNIINMLEVAESDFAKDLAEEEKTESDAVEEYETTTEDNKMTKMTSEQDVKYKTAEFKGLDKSIAEVSGDRSTVSNELAAVNEYFAKIKERCVAKPESYEERKARREAEINGLKEALDTLNNEAAFVQRRKHSHLRGVLAM